MGMARSSRAPRWTTVAIASVLAIAVGIVLLVLAPDGARDAEPARASDDPPVEQPLAAEQRAIPDNAIVRRLPSNVRDVVGGYPVVQLTDDAQLYREPSVLQPAERVAHRTPYFGMDLWLPVLETDDGGFARVPVPFVGEGSELRWLYAPDTQRFGTQYVIVVSLAQRRMWVLRRGELAFEQQVTIGDADSPTPTGTFFVTDRVDVPERLRSVYGSRAYGLSVLQDDLPAGWSGGNQVAIHGGPDAALTGTGQTAGCIVLSNRTLDWLWPRIGNGTIVVVQP
jgi:hypothetical protein